MQRRRREPLGSSIRGLLEQEQLEDVFLPLDWMLSSGARDDGRLSSLDLPSVPHRQHDQSLLVLGLLWAVPVELSRHKVHGGHATDYYRPQPACRRWTSTRMVSGS